jgi:NADH-quinone oxidoreductase subunit E
MEVENKIEFSKETLDLLNRIIARYPEGRQKSALLPALHIAQSEFGGWLSIPVMDYVASLLQILPVEVYEVATFYKMFNMEPVGKCVIEICRTGPCWQCGAEEIIDHLEKKLNIKAGETTTDGRFTLKTVECLADCGNAPVMQTGWDFYGKLTIDKVDKLLDDFIEEDKTSHLNPYKI